MRNASTAAFLSRGWASPVDRFTREVRLLIASATIGSVIDAAAGAAPGLATSRARAAVAHGFISSSVHGTTQSASTPRWSWSSSSIFASGQTASTGPPAQRAGANVLCVAPRTSRAPSRICWPFASGGAAAWRTLARSEWTSWSFTGT